MKSRVSSRSLLDIALEDVLFEYQDAAKQFILKNSAAENIHFLNERYHHNYPTNADDITVFYCNFYYIFEQRFLGYSANLFENNIIVSKAPFDHENSTFIEILEREKVAYILRLDSADRDRSNYENTKTESENGYRSKVVGKKSLTDDVFGLRLCISNESQTHTCELYDIFLDDNTHPLFSANDLLALQQFISKIKTNNNRKTLIHCASGLGRAATINFILQVMLDDYFVNELAPNFFSNKNHDQIQKDLGLYYKKTLSSLRRKRYSIHKESQYKAAILTTLTLVKLKLSYEDSNDMSSAAKEAEIWQRDQMSTFQLSENTAYFVKNTNKKTTKEIPDSLKELCEIPATCGFEENVTAYLFKQWKPLMSSLQTDNMGNLLGYLTPPKDDKPTVLFMAHMDEVGLIVRDISDDGFIYFDTLGGQVDEVLAGTLWDIHTKDGVVKGYTGLESGHTIMTFPNTEKIPQKNLFIDIGAKTREEVLSKGIREGSAITYAGERFHNLGNGRILATAIDDRFALSVLTELFKTVDPEHIDFNVAVAATVQEEVGMRGAEVVYDTIKADIVINLDIGKARDYRMLLSDSTKTPKTSCIPKLGGGVSFTAYNSQMITTPALVEYFIKLCKILDINYQMDNSTMSSTDACRLQRSGNGVPVFNLGIPMRYPHSQYGMMDINDYHSLVKLMDFFCKNYNQKTHKKLFKVKQYGLPMKFFTKPQSKESSLVVKKSSAQLL